MRIETRRAAADAHDDPPRRARPHPGDSTLIAPAHRAAPDGRCWALPKLRCRELYVDHWVTDTLSRRPALRRTLRHHGVAAPALPPWELAALFAVETTYPGTNYTPVGVHKAWAYLSAAKLDALSCRCPPLRARLSAARGSQRRALDVGALRQSTPTTWWVRSLKVVKRVAIAISRRVRSVTPLSHERQEMLSDETTGDGRRDRQPSRHRPSSLGHSR